MDNTDLAQRVQMAFDRCKQFPEISARDGNFVLRGDAFMALIELRNLMPDVVLALHHSRSSQP